MQRTSTSPTALRAHMNFLQFACNVPIETEQYVSVEPQCLHCLYFEIVPRLRHCLRQGMPVADPMLRIDET